MREHTRPVRRYYTSYTIVLGHHDYDYIMAGVRIQEKKDVSDDRLQRKRLYPELKKFMEIYSEKYKSPVTVIEMSILAVTPAIIKKEYSDALVTFSSRGLYDTVRFRELYDSIVTYAGSRLIDRLLELVRQRFLIAPAVNIYMQAVTNHYLNILLVRDDVSSKQLFQLLLNDGFTEINDEDEL